MKRLSLRLDQLAVNPAINPRHGQNDDVSDLVAQIRANGFSDAIWVRPAPTKGKAKKGSETYEVIDGSRRLRALRLLAKELKITTIPCDCFEADDGRARELALAANVTRSDLSPADEAQAFASLKLGGMAASEIATRFAVPERRVLQRIALGTLAPAILDALRGGEINIETAQAFTLTTARERQQKIFADLKKKHHLYAHYVRNAIKGEDGIAASDGRVKLVGIDAYAAAGGTINVDLFGDGTSLTDAKLLDRLFAEKTEQMIQALKADGWSWAKLLHEVGYDNTSWEYPRVAPRGTLDETRELKQQRQKIEAEIKASRKERDALDEKGQNGELDMREEERLGDLEEHLAALDEQLSELNTPPYTDAQKAKYGAIIHVRRDEFAVLLGRKTIAEGKADEKKAAARHAQGRNAGDLEDDDAGDDGVTGDGLSNSPAEATGPAYSETVMQLLLVAARNDCKLALAMKPAMAARLGLAARVFGLFRGSGSPFIAAWQGESGGPEFYGLLERTRTLFDGCENFAGVVARLETMEPEAVASVDAVVTAAQLKFQSLKDPDVRAVMDMVEPVVGSEGFTVDADFLARLNREQLSLIAVELGAEVPKGKKPDMISALLPLIAAAGWVPAPLRTASHYAASPPATTEDSLLADDSEVMPEADSEREAA